MKAILMSIKPQHVANILNELKTLEIRKRFPSDYVGWVYIYCTKGKPEFYFNNRKSFVDIGEQLPTINGRVVARFWCDRVIDFFCYNNDLLKQACLTEDELLDYLGDKDGYAIHITKLEIFDYPKEINVFNVMRVYTNCDSCPHSLEYGCSSNGWCGTIKPLTRAPQSWCFIEI